jgi:phosphatidylserine/phosphatidylglycerophosphate/cardiolipin synthase-like enzyme
MAISIRTSSLILALILLAGCGTLPQKSEHPVSAALKPSTDSPLVRVARDSAPSPDMSGFRLMPLGVYALDARVQLARRAKYSLDLQYYLVQNDRTGRLLLRNLRDAAMRGVRVRLLVDDLYTTGGDPLFVGLAAFPKWKSVCSIRFAVRVTASLASTPLHSPTSAGSITGCTTSSSSPMARSP